MYAIYRKSDMKFKTTTNQSWYKDEKRWSLDFSKARLYRTIGAAKSSMPYRYTDKCQDLLQAGVELRDIPYAERWERNHQDYGIAVAQVTLAGLLEEN